jgi:hypothetical protein
MLDKKVVVSYNIIKDKVITNTMEDKEMTVVEFMEMFIESDDQYFELWDNNKEIIVFRGYLFDLDDEELECATVSSIDNIYGDRPGITLNIDTE